MEKSDAIRRAMRQTAQYELPSGFTPRLMTRVRERQRRRETYETLAYLSGGVACFAALIAGGIGAWTKYLESKPLAELSPEMPSMPELRIPDIGAAFTEQNQIWLSMTAAIVVLSVCDILLRRRLRNSNTGK